MVFSRASLCNNLIFISAPKRILDFAWSQISLQLEIALPGPDQDGLFWRVTNLRQAKDAFQTITIFRMADQINLKNYLKIKFALKIILAKLQKKKLQYLQDWNHVLIIKLF